MRPRSTALLCSLLAGCSSVGTRSTAIAPSARAVGTFAAKLALTGRSTYTGALQLEATSRDSLRGPLRLSSPLNVDAVLAGVVRSDSLILTGTYTAANGCTGGVRASLFMPTDRAAEGTVQLADKCAGTLNGTMTVTR